MPVFDFSDEEMDFIRAAAAEQYETAKLKNVKHNGTNLRAERLYVLGVMGEYAVAKHFRVPIYRWHGLFQHKLPDVDCWEVRTRAEIGSYLGMNKKNITDRTLNQKIILCYASLEHRSCEVYGWTTYRTIRDKGISSDNGIFWLLDAEHLERF